MPEPLVDAMQALADKFIERAGALRRQFDYTVASAYAADQFLDVLIGSGEAVPDDLARNIGAYVGEVIRRNVGGEWVAMPQGPSSDEPGVSVNGLVLLPFEKVRKRINLGTSNSLGFFVEELVQSGFTPPPGPEKRRSGFRRRGRS